MKVTTSAGKSVSYDKVEVAPGEFLLEMAGEYFVLANTANLVVVRTESGFRVARGVNEWEAIRDLAEVTEA